VDTVVYYNFHFRNLDCDAVTKKVNMNNFHLAIISTGRPQNVEFMQKLCEPFQCNWYVNNGEADVYRFAGANFVFESGTNICQARNLALEHAFENALPCIQISDDLRSIKQIYLDEASKRKTEFVTVEYVCKRLVWSLQQTKLIYGGVAVSSNPLNYTGEDVSTDKLIVNDFICVMPSDYRFDEDLALKEDYDMSILNLLEAGGVLRLNNVLCDFPHRQNKGGANIYRNDNTEGIATQKLLAKWPQFVKMNPRRPGQVLLNYPAIRGYRASKQNTLFNL
jgi:hypothetical protein